MNKGLTSFRALAFFAIFLFHINFIGGGHLGIQGGYLGVEAFFVLSGFLLTPILVDMKLNLSKKDFFIHFYGRRALRIFPLYYAYIATVASVYFLSKSQYGRFIPMDRFTLITESYKFIENLPWTMTYLFDFYHAGNHYIGTSFDNHLWSLAVEEQFYLAWPLAIFFIPANQLKKFLLLVILAGPLIRLLMAMILDANMFDHIPTNGVIYLLPFSYIDAFAVGGYFSLYGKNRPVYLVWVSIVLVLMLGMITSWLSAGQIYWDQLGYGYYMEDSYKYIWGYSVVNLMVAYALVHVRDKTFMPVLFENPLLVYMGKISYGLYVFHLPVLWLVYLKMHDFPEIVRASTALLITVMISMVSYEFMEKRFIKLKDKYFARASVNKSINPVEIQPLRL